MRFKMRFLIILFVGCFLLNGCTFLRYNIAKSSALDDNSEYALIKVKKNRWVSGQIVKEGSSVDIDPAYWASIVDGESALKGFGKIAYSFTPYGMIGRFTSKDTGILYRLSPGVTNLLVFNYYSRQLSGNKKERSCWGTVISADLKAGQTYMLSASTVKTDSSYFKEIPAFIFLQDKDGNNIQKAYSFFHPAQKEDFTIAWTRPAYSTLRTNPHFDFIPLSFGEKIMAEAGAQIAAEMSATMMDYINTLDRFLYDLEERKGRLATIEAEGIE